MNREKAEKEIQSILWNMAAETDKDGCKAAPLEERQKVIALLRATANTLEANPENIKGLVLMTGGRVEKPGEEEQVVESTGVIIGTPAALAATFVQFKPIGEAAFEEVAGELVARSLIGSLFR